METGTSVPGSELPRGFQGGPRGNQGGTGGAPGKAGVPGGNHGAPKGLHEGDQRPRGAAQGNARGPWGNKGNTREQGETRESKRGQEAHRCRGDKKVIQGHRHRKAPRGARNMKGPLEVPRETRGSLTEPTVPKKYWGQTVTKAHYTVASTENKPL